MTTDKTLIVGVDTLAGANIALTWADRCEIVGVTSRRRFILDRCRAIVAAPADPRALADIIDAEAPTTIIYSGLISSSAWEWSREYDLSSESERLAAVCRVATRRGSRVIVISSDAACFGPFLFRRDDDHRSVDVAPLAIRRIETAATHSHALVVRTHLFGWRPTADSWIERIWTAISEGRPVYASGTHYATPILASDFAELLWNAKTCGLHGLYNLAGAERASMWHFATVLSGFAGVALKVMSPDSVLENFKLESEPRTGQETSLDSRRIQSALRLALPRLQDSVRRFVEQAKNGYRDRIAAAISPPASAAAAA